MPRHPQRSVSITLPPLTSLQRHEKRTEAPEEGLSYVSRIYNQCENCAKMRPLIQQLALTVAQREESEICGQSPGSPVSALLILAARSPAP